MFLRRFSKLPRIGSFVDSGLFALLGWAVEENIKVQFSVVRLIAGSVSSKLEQLHSGMFQFQADFGVQKITRCRPETGLKSSCRKDCHLANYAADNMAQ